MKPNLNKQDIGFLIDCLKNGKEIPEVYKYAIFPTKQKEYELVYAGKMRKEDVLADTEEAKPVPLQIEKVFNGKKYPLYSKDWHNLLVFGDNLQILKTFNENKDPLVRGKIKGKIKLIYIDPPFATQQDFKAKQGQRAYSDKTQGADFIEFLRRRLIVAKELLSNDGCIFVHLDYRYKHHLRILMDEIFGEANFINEIAVSRIRKNIKEREKVKKLNEDFDTIFLYSKTENFSLLPPTKIDFKPDRWHSFDASGFRNGMDYDLFGHKPDVSRHWHWTKEKAHTAIKNYDEWEKNYSKEENLGDYYRRNFKNGTTMDFVRPKLKNRKPEYFIPSVEEGLCNNLWNDIVASSFTCDYPTEKNEKLLNRIVEMATNPGDLVLDFFCGSGTTLAVAEKLNRRWIGCDIGKLAIYTTQKRLLEIDKSKNLVDQKKKYGKPAKSFAVVTSGLYDLGKIFTLQKDEYIRFVKDLFEIEETKTTKIGGVDIDGKKREFYTKIFPYWELKNASVDEKYLQELHKNIGKKIAGKFYIIAPANNVNFISDYHQIGNVRYYFLKVPYQIIKELHKVQFKKFRQPQSKSQINDLDEAIGFHFIRQPEVKSEIKKLKDKIILKIKKFESAYSQSETGEKLKNFESLAMLLIDLNYDGEKFMMTNYFFAQDLLNHKKEEEDESEEEIKKKLTKQKEIKKEFPKKDCGKQIMAIYVDIYGNEFREVFKVK